MKHSYNALTSLGRDTNDTASGSRTSVTGLEGLLVVTLAEIVSAGVDNDGAANDAVGANQLDKVVGDGALGIALSISLDVAEVTNVTGLIRGSTVGLVEGVEVRAGRGAAVGVVAKGVDVEATLGVGVIAGDVVGDGGRGTLRGLLEDDGAGDLGVSSEDSNCSSSLADGSRRFKRTPGCDAIAPRPSRDTLAPATSSNGKRKKQG